MQTLWSRVTRQWRDAINLVLAVWLFVSPWVLGYQGMGDATWNAWVLAAIIAVASVSALVAFHEWEEWVTALLGLWLVVSPWLVGFADVAAAMWNQIVIGVIVGGLALSSVWTSRHRDLPAT